MSHEEELTALRTRVDRLEAALRSAEETLDQVRQQLKSAEMENREYKRKLIETLPEGPSPFTEAEMQDLIENGVTWEVIEQDLKRLLEE